MTWVVDLLGRSLPIILGAGAVQLIIFFVKRRSELRALDAATTRTGAEAGSVVVTSAERSLALSDQVRDSAVRRADEANARADGLEIKLAAQAERLAYVEREVRRLTDAERGGPTRVTDAPT